MLSEYCMLIYISNEKSLINNVLLFCLPYILAFFCSYDHGATIGIILHAGGILYGTSEKRRKTILSTVIEHNDRSSFLTISGRYHLTTDETRL